ncbi:MAG: hypothetical protein WDO19_01825 [Bacteroidota bacterium]
MMNDIMGDIPYVGAGPYNVEYKPKAFIDFLLEEYDPCKAS